MAVEGPIAIVSCWHDGIVADVGLIVEHDRKPYAVTYHEMTVGNVDKSILGYIYSRAASWLTASEKRKDRQ